MDPIFCTSYGTTKNVKVIDFGSSCYIGGQKCEYIQSRYYRAPEVILRIKYGPPMDIWNFACIIVKLLIGSPLFPGTDEKEQHDMYMEILGIPPKHIILCSSRRIELFGHSMTPIARMG